eukprot:TRINITY_DN8433_c0_g1_i1.p1 TRINITY_DN8433_c0_g1~~TRINITY_DN8433_c0_g1_i1.p1  ORF type:complete len:136 (-),score=10.59 TRINITY_DN8433_c0_g1_i1:614-1021(-)
MQWRWYARSDGRCKHHSGIANDLRSSSMVMPRRSRSILNGMHLSHVLKSSFGQHKKKLLNGQKGVTATSHRASLSFASACLRSVSMFQADYCTQRCNAHLHEEVPHAWEALCNYSADNGCDSQSKLNSSDALLGA